MEQLIMRWKNDGSEAIAPVFPEGVSLVTYTNLPNAMAEWLDIVRFMGQEEAPARDEAYYREAMDYKWYSEDKCFFLTVGGKPAATITVICDKDKRDGYIHMVACKPHFRGKGLGHLLNSVALYTLKTEGMETASLTTDDWRIPAIKTYLKAGFYADLETHPDFPERWEKIMAIIG